MYPVGDGTALCVTATVNQEWKSLLHLLRAFETWGARISRTVDRRGKQGRTGHLQADSETSGQALGGLRSRWRGESPSRVAQGPV